MRAAPASVRRREGRRPLQSARDVSGRAPAAHPAVHDRVAAGDRPGEGHPGARHGDERADDGLDDGHVLDAGRLRRPRGRDREADLDRRLRLPERGDRRRGRDGHRARLPPARLGPRRAGVRRAGLRERGRRRGAGPRSAGREGARRLRHLGRHLLAARARRRSRRRLGSRSTGRSRTTRTSSTSRTPSCSSSRATSSSSRRSRSS